MANISTDTHQQNAALSRIPTITHPRNTFPLIKKGCTTHQFDILHPIYCKEVIPGDTINLTLQSFARLQTQAIDLFDDLYTDYHVWYGRNRQVQTNFDRLFFDSQITGPTQDNSALTTPNVKPIRTNSTTFKFLEKTLYDDLEYPTGLNLYDSVAGPENYQWIQNYKARHYNNIYNLNYRDQNLQDAVHLDYDEGPDDAQNYVLLKRGRRHDMPSSCLPFRQKGTAPLVPLSGSLPITSSGAPPTFSSAAYTDRSLIASTTTNVVSLSGAAVGGAPTSAYFGGTTGLQVSLALAGFYVNDARFTVAVQQLLEANARGGTRSVEALSNIWGVQLNDAFTNRPEYLGGATFSFDGHVVPQTSSTSGSSYQAGLASFSQSNHTLKIAHSFTEPGYLMILVSHRSNQTYQNMMKREHSRKTKYDFFNPFFANLGETQVLSEEISIDSTSTYNSRKTLFGYNRYAYEYIYETNSVTREMKSNATNSLDSRHLAYDIIGSNVLNSDFILSNTDAIDRNIVVSRTVADPIQINFKVSGSIARQIPLDSIPGLMRF